ncbi:hypothetical protein NECAME_03128 [Necator americanus]|uniref:Uncharacterized protein n=1 Tax=Necator americanus TaxID=51031 RepID=W2T6S7_NECAM|nr:hypothetical protein NECAME_03128 [Necator americanus]ETN77710.1 hypothetical protein NECAME_03128 [Necator americanus]
MKQGTSGQKGVEPDNDNARPNLRARFVALPFRCIRNAYYYDDEEKEKMSAYERAKKVYEQIQEEKQQQRLLRKQEEEERQAALEKYEKTKKKANKLFRKRSRKGQPNLGAQVEVLLEKIERKGK